MKNLLFVLLATLWVGHAQAQGFSGGGASGGTPCTSTASSLQYNNSGAFGCVSGVTSNGTNLTGAVGLDTAAILTLNADTFLGRSAAATFRFGAVDAAAPVAQSIGVQNVVAGTSNVAGQNLTINGSQSTGTGAGGSIILKTAPAGTTGTSQNTLTTAMTLSTISVILSSGGTAKFTADIFGNIVLASNGSINIPTIINSAANLYNSSNPGTSIAASSAFGWVPSTNVAVSQDTSLARNAAGIVEINNGTACSTTANCRDLKLRNIIGGGSAPAMTGTCAATTQVGGNSVGTFVANGACVAGTYIMTFATTAPNGWVCNTRDRTTPADSINQTADSATTATFAATTAASDVVQFECRAY